MAEAAMLGMVPRSKRREGNMLLAGAWLSGVGSMPVNRPWPLHRNMGTRHGAGRMAEVLLFWKQEGKECMRPCPTFNTMLAGMICRKNSYQHGVSKRQDTGLAFGILLSSAGLACLRVRRRKHASFRNKSEAQTRDCVLGIGSV